MQHNLEAQDRKSLERAIGSLLLEGIEPDPKSLSDMEYVVTGKISTDEFVQQSLERIRREQI